MEYGKQIRALRLQLLIERIVVSAVALILLGVWISGRIADGKTLILVDGKPVVCVPSQREAREILREVKSQTGLNPSEIQFRQQVAVARAPRDAQPVSRHKAVRVVRDVISPVAPRWSIIVNGRPVVALPDRETAGKALDMARMRYGKLVKNLAEEPQFKEDVTVAVESVDPSIFRKTADEAVKVLLAEGKPVTRESVYIVRSGDVGASIARRHGISVEALQKFNPDLNLARLQIGNRIRVKATQTKGVRLTVVVRDLSERTVNVPAPVQRVTSAALYAGKTSELTPGKPGKTKITQVTIYENGHKVGSEVVDEEILQAPTPRRIAVGNKPVPTW